MNLLDAVVKEVGTPRLVHYKEYTWWAVNVKYDCYGSMGETTLFFDTEEEAKEVQEGYKIIV